MISKKLTIINKLGLHARAAAKLVNLTAKFESEIQIKKREQTVNGKSIMGLMMLAANKGTELTIVAIGEDEEHAISKIEGLVNDKFGEAE